MLPPLLYNNGMYDTDSTYELDGRVYQLPETSRNEQQQFYENLRAVQRANNAEIRTQTENLGTDVPSAQGGLIGPESYFTSRYQTPQTNQTIAELRSTAQASALNAALSNLQSQYQKRYEDAYRNYQKRASSGSGDTTTTGSVEEESTGNDGIKVSAENITATTAPREGLSDTTYYRDGHWYTEYSDGSVYEDGILIQGPRHGSGMAQGNGKSGDANINRSRSYANPFAGTLNNEGGGGW